MIADNKLAENAGWDREILALELEALSSLDIGFDLEITGFETCEIDLLIEEHQHAPEEDPLDAPPDLAASSTPVSEPGNLWLLGSHKLLVGDATDPDAYRQLMGDEAAQLVFIDPPYNVPIAGNVSGLGKVKHCDFKMASGEMSQSQFIGFLQQAFDNLANNSAEGSIHYVCMDWRHLREVLDAGEASYTELKNLCVWAKTSGMPPKPDSFHLQSEWQFCAINARWLILPAWIKMRQSCCSRSPQTPPQLSPS